jgi:hypothetical protein
LAILGHEADKQMAHSQYATSRAKPKKERKLWYYLLEIMTTWDASLIK